MHKILLKISCNKAIETTFEVPTIVINNINNIKKNIHLKNQILKRTLQHDFITTSFSNLCRNYNIPKKIYNINVNNNKCQQSDKIVQLTPHTFPKGKEFGIFIHNILKNINFHKDVSLTWISKQLLKNNFDLTWSTELRTWIQRILNTPLNDSTLILSQLSKNNYIKELEFFFPIKKQITDTQLYEVLKIYHKSLNSTSKIHFNPIQGMFTGSIDLIFKWNHKYYLLDYKSNWLGYFNCDYAPEKIKKVIIKHHYDLQCQLYSIALHRYLQQRIKDYSFTKYFGGIYIMFVRAIDNSNLNKGVLFTLPNLEIINNVNNLFFNKIV
ncbi:MAG: hypothetical protein U0W94_02140 [Buchnera aphidicola (Schlechtendalia peitan)]